MRRRAGFGATGLTSCVLTLVGCATAPGSTSNEVGGVGRAQIVTPLVFREAFPGVRIDAAAGVVEFDAMVSPMLVPDARAPRFYLEVVCCSPDTREHETFVVTRVGPSHLHAALLAVGLKSGTPGSFRQTDHGLETIDPAGDRVEVRFVYEAGGATVEADPLAWVARDTGGAGFLETERARAQEHGGREPGWVFAGSRMAAHDGRDVYDADGTGVVIGLTTFGSEVLSWSRTISPDSAVEAPSWVADFSKTPPAGTAVRVRVRAAR